MVRAPVRFLCPTGTFVRQCVRNHYCVLCWSSQKQLTLSHRTATPFVYARQIVHVTVVTITRIPRDDRHNKRECDTNFFVCLLVRRYRTDALGAATDLLRTTLRFEDLFAMRNEHSGKYTPRPSVCPSCAQIMRLARTTLRFGSLPDLYIFECRACGVSRIDEAHEPA